MAKGWKTLAFGLATALLGVLQSTQITNIVAEYPGTVTTVVGIVVMFLRFVTTSSIFKSE